MPEIRPLTIRQLREKAMRLPLTSGVYLMKDRQGKIIYVGKAKALKNRVSQYFGSHKNHGVKVVRMVEHVADFDYILTDSEFEALVLECSLIKQYAPKYNILLKDDKGYSYIRVSNDGWPMISAVLQKADDGATYIGPYTSHFTVNNSVDEALRIYRLPRCGKTFPRDIGKGRPCLNYFIKQCSAPCAGKISEQEYRETVEEALLLLKGGTGDALRDLEKRMTDAAENLEFEKAARLRDRIAAIKRSADKQKVYSAAVEEQDVFALVSEKEKSCLNVLRFGEGRLRESEFFILDTPENAQLLFDGPTGAAAHLAGRRDGGRGADGTLAVGKSGTQGDGRCAAARRTDAARGALPQKRRRKADAGVRSCQPAGDRAAGTGAAAGACGHPGVHRSV